MVGIDGYCHLLKIIPEGKARSLPIYRVSMIQFKWDSLTERFFASPNEADLEPNVKLIYHAHTRHQHTSSSKVNK